MSIVTPLQPHLVFVSQKVKDIKLPPNGRLEFEIAGFRKWLHKYSFIPGEKVTARIVPLAVEDGVLYANIEDWTSGVEANIKQRFTLDLPVSGPLPVEHLFSQVKGARVDDGGNVQNSIVNAALACVYSNLAEDLQANGSGLRITIVSSSDPFAGLSKEIVASVGRFCQVFVLELSDRISIHCPWEEDGEQGTFSIASEPQRLNKALKKLLEEDKEARKAFQSATCFISADPIYEQLATYAKPPYVCVINASTAFRALVATESYNRCVILPMNNGEASDVCRLLLQRGTEEELNATTRPPFESPLASNGNEIDTHALRQLDESLDIFRKYNPPNRNVGRASFTCPISFGPDGGLVISTGRHEIACFTSTPENEEQLLSEFGSPGSIKTDRIYEVGAGDAVATIIALFNAIDPRVLIDKHLAGRESKDELFRELVGAVFVSTLGRVLGNFLVRTTDTHWSNVEPRLFRNLLNEVALESLEVSRQVYKKLRGPVIAKIARWGITVVLWRPGRVAFPNREP